MYFLLIKLNIFMKSSKLSNRDHVEIYGGVLGPKEYISLCQGRDKEHKSLEVRHTDAQQKRVTGHDCIAAFIDMPKLTIHKQGLLKIGHINISS